MLRLALGAFLLLQEPVYSIAAQMAQQQPGQTGNSSQNAKTQEEPPEEDESLVPENFVLNPLESERNVRVGNYYWHKGKYRAAAGRYERATRYNPSSAEAFYKLGEAQQKLKNLDAARTAFRKVLQLAPESKLGQEAKKRLSKT